jgi:ATP-binding cassette, subfamily B, bacterial
MHQQKSNKKKDGSHMNVNKKAWKFYLSYFKDRYSILIISFFLTICQAAIFLPIALVLRKILNDYIGAGDSTKVLYAGLLVFGLLVTNAGIRLLNKYLIVNHNKKIHNKLRDDLFVKMYDVPKLFYTRLENMRWHTIFTHDVLRLDAMSDAILTSFIPAIVISMALGVVMIYINWILFLFMLAIAPLLFLTVFYTSGRIRRLVFERRKAIQLYNSRINFTLEMMDLTRIQVAEDQEITKQLNQNAYLRALDFKTAWLNEVFRTIQDTLIMIMTVVLLVGGGMAAINDSISLGDLFTFYVVFMFNRKYLIQVFNFVPTLISGNEGLERIYEIVSVGDDRPYLGKTQPSGKSDIVVENISFSYTNDPLLENISIHINEGEFVALQGDNGSGKTTLLYLILGFYRPHKGQISYGGIPHDQIDIKSMRKEFGVVLQESPIFRGTILENIIYGRTDIQEDAYHEACTLAGIDLFTKDLPDGINTEVGDRGLLLSGGQRQRIAVARALLTQPKVLVLDEPTNHLDKYIVNSLLDSLQQLSYKPTIIMISHIDEFVSRTNRVIRVDTDGVTEFVFADKKS